MSRKGTGRANFIVTFRLEGRYPGVRAAVVIDRAWNGQRHLSELMALAEHVARTGAGIHASVPSLVVEGIGPEAVLGVFRITL